MRLDHPHGFYHPTSTQGVDHIHCRYFARRGLQGAAACGDCHDDRLKALRAGAHKTVNCEVCHAPLGRHVKDGDVVAPMNVERSFTLCARCHRRILGRPEKFPQVVLEQHVQQQGPAKLEGKVCLDCHDPHSPKL